MATAISRRRSKNRVIDISTPIVGLEETRSQPAAERR